MTERRYGDRHPDAWNPIYGWQIIRRSELYRKSIRQFVSENDEYGNEINFRLFRELKSEHKDVPLEARRALVREVFEIDPSYLPLKNFLLNFGDLLRYPIPFTTEFPDPFYLNALWHFRPATLVDRLHVEAVARERGQWRVDDYDFGPSAMRDESREVLDSRSHPALGCVTAHFEINSSFSDAAILDSIQRSAKEFLKMLRKRGHHPIALPVRKSKPHWDNFPKQLKAWDLKKNTDLGYDRIGKLVYPKMPVRKSKGSVKSHIKTISALIEAFEKRRNEARVGQGKVPAVN